MDTGDKTANNKVVTVPILGRGPSYWQKARARKEARTLARTVRRGLKRHGFRIAKELQDRIATAVTSLDDALLKADHDAICAGMVQLDHLAEEHLDFGRKSVFREYADSIGVAVLVALFLRAFVVEAFKIPSGSMIPTMEVGDHIFVNKFLYGLRIPFTKIKFFEFRKPRRGEVIVFIYPRDPDKDFIKRIVAIEGDTVQVKDNVLYVNGTPVPRKPIPGVWAYKDYDENTERWSDRTAVRVEEELGGEHYTTIYDPRGIGRDFPSDEDDARKLGMEWVRGAAVIPKNTVFCLGDNRNNSHDSRYWGPVPLENIKGRALVVWWSGGPDGVRWDRLGHIVD